MIAHVVQITGSTGSYVIAHVTRVIMLLQLCKACSCDIAHATRVSGCYCTCTTCAQYQSRASISRLGRLADLASPVRTVVK